MYALRGIAVSLSIFFILYMVMSAAIGTGWRRLLRYSQGHSARSSSNLLFALRVLPAVAAAVVTLALAVPSFVILEPRSVDEPLGVLPLLLGCCGIALVLVGLWNAAYALVRASRAVAQWSLNARVVNSLPVEISDQATVLRTSGAAPPITAAGILKPTVWLSRSAEFVLNERELDCALRHEMAHVRRRDNLRKLALCLVAFPGMAQIERAWREATEMAADDAAVTSAAEALDLAAAVIKLSRLVPLHPPAELTTGLVHSPAESVNARVQRLVDWKEVQSAPPGEISWRYAVGAAASLTAVAVTYSHLLLRMHAATEWLVR
jgi:beta-lactamase regulating signal transducer with metallopeptidase domain